MSELVWDQLVDKDTWFIHNEADGLTIFIEPHPTCARHWRLRAESRQDSQNVTFSTSFASVAAAKERAEILMEVACEELAKDRS